MKKVTLIGIKISLLLAVIIFQACDSEKNQQAIRIGTNMWLGYEPLYLARKLDKFKNRHINLNEMPSASDVICAFKDEMIDCAALTLDEAYLLLQDSIDIKILFVMDISDGADVLLGKPEITELGQLKGKNVGVENTAVGAFLLSRALEFGNIKPNEIKITPLIEAAHLNAFKKIDVDAIVTFEPNKTKLINEGAVNLFDSKKIPNEIFDVFIVRTKFYEKHKNEMEEIKNIWFNTLPEINTKNNEILKFTSKRLGLTEEELILSYNGIKFPNKSENDEILKNSFLKSAVNVRDIMLKMKILKHSIDPQKLIIGD